MNPQSKKTNSNGPFTQEDQQKLMMKENSPKEFSHYCSNASISRYPRARNWNVKKAVKMLEASLIWRMRYKPEEILWNTQLASEQVKYVVYCMENAISNLPPGQEQTIWLIDFHGFSLSNISIKSTKETAYIMQEHYPERLGLAILYDPPKLLEPFYKVVKPFLEPKTANKMKFVYSNDPNAKTIMEDLFCMDELESAFGGKLDETYDIKKCAEMTKEDDAKMIVLYGRENYYEPSCNI